MGAIILIKFDFFLKKIFHNNVRSGFSTINFDNY